MRLPSGWTSPAFRPYSVPAALVAVAFALSIAFIWVQEINPWGVRYNASAWQTVVYKLFNMDAENNVPTWYSSTLWIICAYFASRAARLTRIHNNRIKFFWWMVSCICIILSIDETASIHELAGAILGGAVATAFNINDSFYYSWVIGGLIFAFLVFAVTVPFLRYLGPATCLFLLLSGCTFLFAAVGIETATSAINKGAIEYEPGTRLWTLLILLEEGGEMAAVIIAIHAILLHLRSFSAAKPPRLSDDSAIARRPADHARQSSPP